MVFSRPHGPAEHIFHGFLPPRSGLCGAARCVYCGGVISTSGLSSIEANFDDRFQSKLDRAYFGTDRQNSLRPSLLWNRSSEFVFIQAVGVSPKALSRWRREPQPEKKLGLGQNNMELSLPGRSPSTPGHIIDRTEQIIESIESKILEKIEMPLFGE